MDERYPIGETTSVGVAVLRHERHDAGYPMWSASIGLRGGEATVSVPGHYPAVLAQRLRAADAQFAPACASAATSTSTSPRSRATARRRSRSRRRARSPVRVTVEVPRNELDQLA